MTRPQRILLVSLRQKVTDTLISWLGVTGCDLLIVRGFASAKEQLARVPDLLITELKLGEYNGLHLALRARAAGIPSIVIGPKDAVLAKEAESIGSTYLTSVLRRSDVLAHVNNCLHASARAATDDADASAPVGGLLPEGLQPWAVGVVASDGVYFDSWGRRMVPH